MTSTALRHRRQERLVALALLTLLLTVVALLSLRHGGLSPGTGSFRQRLLLWTTVPAALLSAGGLLFALGSLPSRLLGVLAGLTAALALLLPAVVTARMDASSEGNGFAGCGTFSDPAPTTVTDGVLMREYAASCAAALRRQKTTVVVLAAPAAITAALSVVHGAGALRSTNRGAAPRRRRVQDGALLRR